MDGRSIAVAVSSRLTTVSRLTEQVTTEHSHCSKFEIEDIGTSHTTLSQQAEQAG